MNRSLRRQLESLRGRVDATGRAMLTQQPSRFRPVGETDADFAVGLATKTGGAAGSLTGSTTCSWVYTIKDLDGNVLGTNRTPKTARIPNCEYVTPPDDSECIIYRDANGDWQLYHVSTERPVTKTLTSITSWRVDGPNSKFQIKTTTARVLDTMAETDWIDAHTGTECTPSA